MKKVCIALLFAVLVFTSCSDEDKNSSSSYADDSSSGSWSIEVQPFSRTTASTSNAS